MAPQSMGRSSWDTEGEPWARSGLQGIHEDTAGACEIRLGEGLGEREAGGPPPLGDVEAAQSAYVKLVGEGLATQEKTVGVLEEKVDFELVGGVSRVSGMGDEGVGHAGGQVQGGTGWQATLGR